MMSVFIGEQWKIVSYTIQINFGNLPKSTRDAVDKVYDSGYLSDPKGVANIFGSHFNGCSSSDVFAESAFLNDHHYSDVFMINRVTVSEITEAMKKLKPKLSTGIDSINSFIFCCKQFSSCVPASMCFCKGM